jgi:hypothetical protein
MVVLLIAALLMMVPPSFARPVLVLSLILVQQVHLSCLVLPPCSSGVDSFDIA